MTTIPVFILLIFSIFVIEAYNPRSDDYYERLGVHHDASPYEITRAFRKLAKRYHPDRNKAHDAEEIFCSLG